MEQYNGGKMWETHRNGISVIKRFFASIHARHQLERKMGGKWSSFVATGKCPLIAPSSTLKKPRLWDFLEWLKWTTSGFWENSNAVINTNNIMLPISWRLPKVGKLQGTTELSEPFFLSYEKKIVDKLNR